MARGTWWDGEGGGGTGTHVGSQSRGHRWGRGRRGRGEGSLTQAVARLPSRSGHGPQTLLPSHPGRAGRGLQAVSLEALPPPVP